MQSRNPAFNEKTLKKLAAAGALEETASMTVPGTINKIGILVCLTLLSSAFAWNLGGTALGASLALGSLIGNLILALVIIFRKTLAPSLAWLYASVEGLLIGSISYYAHQAAPGIAFHAFVGTFGILFTMLGLYHFGILRATPVFKKMMLVAMTGLLLIYLADFVLKLAGTQIPMIHESSPTGIIFSLIAVGVASLCFVLDFDMIETAVASKAPKYMEWYAAFSVLLTIVWLYLELLRLLAKARD